MLIEKIILSTLFIFMSNILKIRFDEDGVVDKDIVVLYSLTVGLISIVLTWNIINSAAFTLVLYGVESYRYKDHDRGFKPCKITSVILYIIEIVCLVCLM